MAERRTGRKTPPPELRRGLGEFKYLMRCFKVIYYDMGNVINAYIPSLEYLVEKIGLLKFLFPF